MKIIRCAAAILVIMVMAGCASAVKRDPASAHQTGYFTTQGRQADGVTLTLTETAKKKVSSNSNFNEQELLKRVSAILDGRGLLAQKPDGTLPKIEIQVTDLRARSTFAAIMFGFMAGNDSLNGDVIVRSPEGTELQRFTISASYALGGLAGGVESARMGWLYDKFAELTLAELTGEGKPDKKK